MNIKKLEVKLTLIEPQLGTVPKNKEIYASYVATKAPVPENGEHEVATVQEVEEKGWTGFHSDEHGLFIYDYMIRGFLKAAAQALKDQVGLKSYKSKIDQLVFVSPRKIRFKRKGKNLSEPDGVVERPLRAMTMQGPRVTLSRSDIVDAGTYLEFEISLVDNKREVTEELIKELFEYGQLSGLGQFRNGSYGRFKVEVRSGDVEAGRGRAQPCYIKVK